MWPNVFCVAFNSRCSLTTGAFSKITTHAEPFQPGVSFGGVEIQLPSVLCVRFSACQRYEFVVVMLQQLPIFYLR